MYGHCEVCGKIFGSKGEPNGKGGIIMYEPCEHLKPKVETYMKHHHIKPGPDEKEIPQPKVLSEPTPINLSGMLYPESEGQPVFLNIEGSPLTYIGIFRTKERLEQSMKEIKKDYSNIKEIISGSEFLESVPESYTVIIDPRLTEKGTVRYTQVER